MTAQPPSGVMAQRFLSAAQAIKDADALYILAGAGMGVSAGLGTFRGRNAGIWPPLEKRGLEFPTMSCPARFHDDDYLGGPRLAWAFWKWRIDAYTSAPTSRAYHIVDGWAAKKPRSSFVFTSNIDGHFIRLASFGPERVYECHGSVAYLQCQRRVASCTHAEQMWPMPVDQVRDMVVDPDTDCIVGDLPMCRGTCGLPARPVVLMFGDGYVLETEMDRQSERLAKWNSDLRATDPPANVVAIEIGAGTAIPTVRWEAERFAAKTGCHLIRINPEAPQIKAKLGVKGHELPYGGEVALTILDDIINCENAADAAQAVDRRLSELASS